MYFVKSASYTSTSLFFFFFFFNDTATTEIYTLSLHDALPIYQAPAGGRGRLRGREGSDPRRAEPAARRAALSRPAATHDLRGHPSLTPLLRDRASPSPWATRGGSGPRWWRKPVASRRSPQTSSCA